MTSNRRYDRTEGAGGRFASSAGRRRGSGDAEPSSSFDGSSAAALDPCNAYTNRACIEACQAMSSVNNVAMCGGWDSHNLSRFSPSNYFGGNRHDDDSDHHHSPYLYSSNAPVGPTSCEYCGNQNTNDCTSNLPEEYVLFMGNQGGACDKGDNPENDDDDGSGKGLGMKNNPNAKANEVCPRPKLFFLKKRPPFATPDGWNPVTEYRTNLFEPPSSAEGMGRGWGEVRGHLGNSQHSRAAAGASDGGVGGGTPRADNLNRSYANSGCGSSACGRGSACGGGPETEVSFSSAGGGDRASTNVTTSDGGSRSLSPVQWVSGLMGALSPS